MFRLEMQATNGETVLLDFTTYEEALRYREAFMLTGDYSSAEIMRLSNA